MAAINLWTTISIIALAITVAIVVYSRTLAVERDFTIGNIIWTYAGTFTAIAVIVGLADMIQNGYGTGDIF